MANSPKCLYVLLACLAGAANVQAQQEDGPDYTNGTLSGDWGGLRPAWSKKGLDLDLGFKSDILRNVRGGIKQGGGAINQFDLKARGDLEKLAGWQGGTAYLNLIYDGGTKTNRDYVGSYMGASNTEVAVSTHRVFHGWIEQAFADSKWSLLAGLYPIDSEFQVLESAGLFVLPPYGPTADLSLTRGPAIFNQSAFGLRGKWQSDNRKAYAMAAVMDGIPGDPMHPHGTHIKFHNGDGTMQIAELGLTPRAQANGAGSKEGGDDPGLEKYSAGYWRYTAKVADLIDPAQRNSSGWYIQGERTMLNWNGGDLVAFLRYSATDGNSTAIRDVSSAGVRVRGIVPGREDDYLGVAYTHSSMSGKWRANQVGVATVGAESAWEVTYLMQVTKWFAVQPLLQQFKSPGAIGGVPDATLVGVKINMAL